MKRTIKGAQRLVAGVLAATALVGTAATAGAHECSFPYPQTERECRSGSLAALGTLDFDRVRGFHLEVNYISGELGAEAVAIGENGEQLLIVGDSQDGDAQFGVTEFDSAGRFVRFVPFSAFYDSATDPSEIRIFVA